MILEPLWLWLTARRTRADAERSEAERLVARHGRDGAATLLATKSSALSPSVLRQVRKRLRVLDTSKGADRWPGP